VNAQLVADHGLTVNDFECMLLLARARSAAAAGVDLAEQLILTASGVTRLLYGLEKEGWVDRAACRERTAAVTYAVLTDKGLAKLREASKTHVADLRAFFEARYTSEELEQLAGLLGRLHADAARARLLGRLTAAAYPLELLPRLGIERVAEVVRAVLGERDGFQVRRGTLRRSASALLPRRSSDGDVRRDEADDLRRAVLGRQPLEQRVGVLRVAHLERTVRLVRPLPSNTSTPRAPLSATKLASSSRSWRRSS
jgi:DNA-binding MarR family transcriptional regulator